MNNYFRSSNKIFIFDETKHTKEISFHHYIMKKVSEGLDVCYLPKGQFVLSKSDAATKLNMNRKTIDRIIKTFIELDIIRVERKEKGRTVYSYMTYLEEKE